MTSDYDRMMKKEKCDHLSTINESSSPHSNSNFLRIFGIDAVVIGCGSAILETKRQTIFVD
jgi:hypothetical protein